MLRFEQVQRVDLTVVTLVPRRATGCEADDLIHDLCDEDRVAELEGAPPLVYARFEAQVIEIRLRHDARVSFAPRLHVNSSEVSDIVTGRRSNHSNRLEGGAR